MSELTTQGQLNVFLNAFHQATGSVTGALFYAGVLTGAVVFPVYAVVLLRRHTRKYMQKVLTEIAGRDPWLCSAVRSKTVFETDEPERWLADLCKWQARYRGTAIFFGSPDLEANCIQATCALLNVFLAWTHEFKRIPPARRQRLIELLEKLGRFSHDPDIPKLVALLQSTRDPLAWVHELVTEVEPIQTWAHFLQGVGATPGLSPKAAALHVNGDRRRLAAALLLFDRPGFQSRREIERFLVAAHEVSARTLRVAVMQIDRARNRKGALVDTVKKLVEGVSQGPRVARNPDWHAFILAFGRTPFAVLDSQPTAPLSVIRNRYQELARQVQAGAGPGTDTVEEQKTLDLAWEVVAGMKKRATLGDVPGHRRP